MGCAVHQPSRIPVGQPGPRRAAVVARVRRQQARPSCRPVGSRAGVALDRMAAALAEHHGPVTIDLGCGTGESTIARATADPSRLVIGIDRSRARLHRHGPVPTNAHLVRANIDDVLATATAVGWTFDEALVLYPNPYPKPGQQSRRLYGRPALLDLLAVARTIVMRTNWAVYAHEFAMAVEAAGGPKVAAQRWAPASAGSAFERKYLAAGHALWAVMVDQNDL